MPGWLIFGKAYALALDGVCDDATWLAFQVGYGLERLEQVREAVAVDLGDCEAEGFPLVK